MSTTTSESDLKALIESSPLGSALERAIAGDSAPIGREEAVYLKESRADDDRNLCIDKAQFVRCIHRKPEWTE